MGRRGSYQKAERYGDRVRLYAPTKTKPWRVVVKDSPPEMKAERSFDDEVAARVHAEWARDTLGTPGGGRGGRPADPALRAPAR